MSDKLLTALIIPDWIMSKFLWRADGDIYIWLSWEILVQSTFWINNYFHYDGPPINGSKSLRPLDFIYVCIYKYYLIIVVITFFLSFLSLATTKFCWIAKPPLVFSFCLSFPLSLPGLRVVPLMTPLVLKGRAFFTLILDCFSWPAGRTP